MKRIATELGNARSVGNIVLASSSKTRSIHPSISQVPARACGITVKVASKPARPDQRMNLGAGAGAGAAEPEVIAFRRRRVKRIWQREGRK